MKIITAVEFATNEKVKVVVSNNPPVSGDIYAYAGTKRREYNWVIASWAYSLAASGNTRRSVICIIK